MRQYKDFLRDASALNMAAMNRGLHGSLDQLVGAGRVLFQEMAVMMASDISSERPWHRDAAYSRRSDPRLVVGVWIALDPILRENRSTELVPGSHLGAVVPHQHENDAKPSAATSSCSMCARLNASL